MRHLKEVTRITSDIDYYYCIIKLSSWPLVYDIYATMLNHLTCLFLGFHTVFLFCYCEGNLNCMHLAYGDMRYLWYIYEGILVWIIPLT